MHSKINVFILLFNKGCKGKNDLYVPLPHPANIYYITLLPTIFLQKLEAGKKKIRLAARSYFSS